MLIPRTPLRARRVVEVTVVPQLVLPAVQALQFRFVSWGSLEMMSAYGLSSGLALFDGRVVVRFGRGSQLVGYKSG